jgi:hypothetical protein
MKMYDTYATAMHAANPRLKLLAYLNGGYASGTSSSYPASWFAHDAKGARITSLMFGNYLMDPSQAGWVANRGSTCKAILTASPGYDGCLADSVGLSALYPGYVSSYPINVATGAAWTKSDWLAAETKLIGGIKAAVTPKTVFFNGLSNGRAYFDATAPSSQLLNSADGGLAETFVRAAHTAIGTHPSVSTWLDDVHMIQDAAVRSKVVIASVKVWVAGTQPQFDAWNEYAMASFLMGYNGYSYYHFRTDKGPSSTTTGAVALGSPINAFYQATAGYYERDFSTGMVLANPGNSTYTVTLPRTFKTLSGTSVTSVTLGPTSGAVLVG